MTNMQKGRLSNLGRQLGRTILNGVREAGPASLRLANRGALHGVNALERIGYMTPRNATNTRIGIEAAGLVDSMRERGRNSITGRRSYMGDIKELSPQHEKLLSRVRANNPYIYDRATDVMQDYPLNAPEHFATNSFRMADNNGQRKIRRPLQDLSRNRLSLEQNNYERLRGKVANGLLGATVGGLGVGAVLMPKRKKDEPSPYGRPMGKSMSKRATMEKGWLRDAARSLARTGRDLGESAAIRIRKPISEARMAAMVTPINAGSYHTVRALEKLRVIRPETARVLKENIINGARVDTNQMMDFAAAHNDAIDRAVSRGGRFLGSDPSKLKMRTAGSNPTSDIKFLMRNGVAPEKIAPLLEGRRSTLTDAEALSGHAYQLGRHKVINTIQDVLSRGQRMRKKPISDNVFLQMMDEHRFNRKLADRYNRTKPTLKKSMSAITKSADMEKPSMPSTRRDIKHTNKYF